MSLEDICSARPQAQLKRTESKSAPVLLGRGRRVLRELQAYSTLNMDPKHKLASFSPYWNQSDLVMHEAAKEQLLKSRA